MKLTLEVITVGKRHPLTISRGTSTGSDNLIVRLDYGDIEGLGEMAPTSGGAIAETALSAEAAFCRWIDLLDGLCPWDSQEIEQRLNEAEGRRKDLAARAALDMAIWDWKGKFAGVPVWKLLGLNRDRIPTTSITVGINPPNIVHNRVQETLLRTGVRHLKVKLGSPDGAESDKTMFAAAQQAAVEIGDKIACLPTWRVDANGGWGVETAARMIEWLAERGVEYVEQATTSWKRERLRRTASQLCPADLRRREHLPCRRYTPNCREYRWSQSQADEVRWDHRGDPDHSYGESSQPARDVRMHVRNLARNIRCSSDLSIG